jgi:pilus assembly protein CpaB
MKSKTMILMVVAVACGLGASYMTSRLLAERNDNPVEEEKVKVLVARKNVPQGTLIKNPEEWFVEKDFTVSDAPKKAVRSFDEVKERVLSKPLSAEQWVIADDLLRKDQQGLATSIPKGMRAMAIKVNVDTVVAGFVQPNSRVDVINTVGGNDEKSYSRTLLQNMLVLAIDTIDTRDQEKHAIISSTVTLAVTAEDAQALSMAQRMGELRLVLRPPDDTDSVALKPTTPEDVRNARLKHGKQPGSSDDDPEASKALGRLPDVPATDPIITTPEPVHTEPAKPKKRHSLLVWNGDSLTKAVFIDGEDEPVIHRDDPEAPPASRPATKPAADKSAAPDKSGHEDPTPSPETPRPRTKGAAKQ